ncbi:MAG TPA: molybdenum ABC transporter permease [Termitinemataceae bacterium]|nr:molybdenum ABC transporter permease [Termitinemataceae bacterium]HOM22869.1 molybdenum ABC transporter permease [Termitinemataceae bacterium]HPP99810.1 molybdenum ABC transporter permease [Termitinemataceae bacterium]
MKFDFVPLWVSFRLGLLVTILALLAMTPLAWYTVRKDTPLRRFFESLLVIPLSLPPTVLGFYILLCWSPRFFPGKALGAMGFSLPFTFLGLVVACTIAHGPHMYQSLRTSFARIEGDLWNASLLLGKGPVETFFRIVLPLSRRGIISGVLTTFLHTLGDFGLVLMIGGSIPAETRTISIALYEQVEKMNYAVAHRYAAVLIGISFLGVYVLSKLQKES